MNLNGKSSKQNIIKLNDMLKMSYIMIQRSLLSTFPPYPSRLSQSMDLSPLHYIAASLLLSNLLMLVYMPVTVVVQLLTRVWLLLPYGLQPISLLCPQSSPSKNTGVGSHSLLQGILLTQGSNLGFLLCQGLYSYPSNRFISTISPDSEKNTTL